MSGTRSFGEATLLVKFDNNAVDIRFGLIVRRIVGIRTHRNIPTVTPLLLLPRAVAEQTV